MVTLPHTAARPRVPRSSSPYTTLVKASVAGSARRASSGGGWGGALRRGRLLLGSRGLRGWGFRFGRTRRRGEMSSPSASSSVRLPFHHRLPAVLPTTRSAARRNHPPTHQAGSVRSLLAAAVSMPLSPTIVLSRCCCRAYGWTRV